MKVLLYVYTYTMYTMNDKYTIEPVENYSLNIVSYDITHL